MILIQQGQEPQNGMAGIICSKQIMERTKKCAFHKFMSIFPRYASANTKILKYFKTEGFLVWYNLAARMDIKPRRVIPLIWHIFFLNVICFETFC